MSTHPGSIWLDQNWNQTQLPNDAWVGATGNGIVAQGDTLESVIGQVIRQGINLDDVTFSYITFGVIQ
jgi:hypothetical protein